MKRFGFLVAFVILAMCWLGLQTSAVYRAFQLLHHKAFIQSILNEQASYTTLSFTPSAWQELAQHNAREIDINHERFDVKDVRQEGNRIVVTGMFDTWETAWYKQTSHRDASNLKPHWIAFFYVEPLERYHVPKPVFYYSSIITLPTNCPLCVGEYTNEIKPPEYFTV